ncbi:hypothetical protein [Seonamhaeicola marinus]|uniref:Uncharacterized protein n=1 Tax=Seonamhaeicola marinus TaxID=1912246 RepID=A0A5D0JAX0_9FLAO|nr:hypothetical protein [Seonamhaeicola marinus]TYA92260.1 hypothetical protein FUA24_02165 [Seonamhaeicola marinus]
MLGLILIYFIGKRFYDLADEHNENKWLYAILGVVIYYAAGFVVGILIGVLDLFVFYWGIDWDNTFKVNLLIGLPSGLISVYGFYILLEKKWKKKVMVNTAEIDDIGRSPEENI